MIYFTIDLTQIEVHRLHKKILLINNTPLKINSQINKYTNKKKSITIMMIQVKS